MQGGRETNLKHVCGGADCGRYRTLYRTQISIQYFDSMQRSSSSGVKGSELRCKQSDLRGRGRYERKGRTESKWQKERTAAKLTVKWHMMLSSKYFVLSSSALKKSYLWPIDW
jgi:hypothetical protein